MAKDDIQKISKSGKVELTQGWWKQCWRGDAPSEDRKMHEAIKAYKFAKNGKSRDALVESLNTLDDLLSSLESKAAKIKMPDGDRVANKVAQDVVTKDIKTARKLVAAQKKTALKASNKLTTIYKFDFGKALGAELKEWKLVKFNAIYVELSLLEVLAVELEEKNALVELHALVHGTVEDGVKACAKQMKAAASDFDGVPTAQFMETMLDIIERNVKAVQGNIETMPRYMIKRIKVSKEVADAFKSEMKKSVAKASAGVAISAAGVAAPGCTPLAVYGLVRSIAGLAQELKRYKASLNVKLKEFNIKAQMLHGMYKGSKKASEMGSSALNAAFGADFLPTYEGMKGLYADILKTMALFFDRSRKMQAQIIEALDMINKIDAAMEAGAVSKNIFKRSHKKRKLEKMRKQLTKQLDNAGDVLGQALKTERAIPLLNQALKNLGDPGKVATRGGKIIGTVVNLGLSVAGGIDAISTGAAESIALASVGLGSDLRDEYKGIFD